MPVEDESFYNILGEEVSRTLLVQKMIDYYQDKKELGETEVTDFNEGSEIRTFLEALAVDVYVLMEDNYEVSKIAFIPTAYGEWLDAHGSHPQIRLERNTGTEAVGMVTFTIPEAVSNDTVIGEGTIITNEDTGLDYATDNECVISAGETSADILVTCLTVGADGNCPANKLTVISEDNDLDSSISVNNSDAIQGGTDYEEDDEYRERLLSFERQDNFGSLPYYENLGNSVNEVHDVLIKGKNENGAWIVTVNGDNKPVEDTVLANVLAEFSDVQNRQINHTFVVQGVTYTTIGTGFAITISTEQELTTNEINELLTCLFNGGVTSNNYDFEGLSINEALSYLTLENAFTSNFDTITSITFTYNSNTFESLEPETDKVLKIDTANITVNQTVNNGG